MRSPTASHHDFVAEIYRKFEDGIRPLSETDPDLLSALRPPATIQVLRSREPAEAVLLEIAAAQDRILITYDRNTMAAHFLQTAHLPPAAKNSHATSISATLLSTCRP